MKKYLTIALVSLFVLSAASSFAIGHHRMGHKRAHHLYYKYHRIPRHHY